MSNINKFSRFQFCSFPPFYPNFGQCRALQWPDLSQFSLTSLGSDLALTFFCRLRVGWACALHFSVNSGWRKSGPGFFFPSQTRPGPFFFLEVSTGRNFQAQCLTQPIYENHCLIEISIMRPDPTIFDKNAYTFKSPLFHH